MQSLDQKSLNKLQERKLNNSLRTLGAPNELTDFSSNDYIGFSKSLTIYKHTLECLHHEKLEQNGATGSRLISGNHNLFQLAENAIAKFHFAESALIFNSGYTANTGLIATIAQRNDVVFFDEFCHASIREAISVCYAKSYKFKHNNLEDLEARLVNTDCKTTVYIITESVFSMDGDSPNINLLIKLSQKYNARIIIDEAHALGVLGKNGCGLINKQNSHFIFARVVTFGKALGCHGAAVLGSKNLIDFLVNFSKPFIYTTGLPPHAVATIYCAYQALLTTKNIKQLQQYIRFFIAETEKLQLTPFFIKSESAIQCIVISGNQTVKKIAQSIQQQGFNVKPILSPTVPLGEERLRFCLHSFNTKKEITAVLKVLKTELK